MEVLPYAKNKNCLYPGPRLRRSGHPAPDDGGGHECGPIQFLPRHPRRAARNGWTRFEALREELYLPVAALLDTKGPEIRLQDL